MIAAEDVLRITGTRNSDDLDLVKRCLDGDQEAWNELVIRYEGLIFSIAIRICPDSESAADILQQVCLELYQRLHEIPNAANLPSWIVSITRRKSSDYWRTWIPTEALDDSSVHSEDIFAGIERQHTLERAVASLPER